MAPANPLRTIEAILEYGSKSSTYKFALIRALTDWVIEHPTARGDQHVPASWLAVRFIDYYWPLLTGTRPVRQNTGRGIVELEEFFHEFQRRAPHDARLARIKVRPDHPAYWAHVKDRLLADDAGAPAVSRLVAQVRRKILEQPIQYLHHLKGARVELLDLHAPDAVDFEDARCQAMGRRQGDWVRNATRLSELLSDDPTTVVIPDHLHEGLVPLRYCIRSAVLGKWATYCEMMPQNDGLSILPRLEPPTLERNSAEVGRYRRLYQDLDLRSCWLTGEPLRAQWALDHVVPWSRFPVNAFWNLLPANPAPNTRKGDRLVQLENGLLDRYEHHVGTCLDVGGVLVERDLVRTFGQAARVDAPAVVGHAQMLLSEMMANTGLMTAPMERGEPADTVAE